jgi:membrane-associated protease RseP (regulator of RpoE activity)
MSAPKHLWSGDWERESGDRTPQPAARPTPTPAPAPPAPEPPQGGGRLSRRTLLAIGTVIAVLGIVGVVLAFTLGGSSQSHAQASARSGSSQYPQYPQSGGSPLVSPSPTYPNQTTPQSTTPQPTSPQPTSPPQQPTQAIGPVYYWLGMELNETENGLTVVTVTLNGAGDDAGVNPGDVIESINTTQVGSVAQLDQAVAKLKLGQRFQLVVDRGSTPVTLSATLTGRPTKSP